MDTLLILSVIIGLTSATQIDSKNEKPPSKDSTATNQSAESKDEVDSKKWTLFSPLIPHAKEELHPLLVHFPIAFLVLEALLLLSYCFYPNEDLVKFSKWLLWIAVISFIPVIYSGIRDVGVELLHSKNPFTDGLRNRLSNFFNTTTMSIHVLYAVASFLISITRLIWISISKENNMKGIQRPLFVASTLLGLWILIAASQVGGSISHE
ncbi:MAG: hypothetical protein HY606_03180 [Planctomycetes bacterium]|nr:hypothetical protein [Planctomycetota bacterium]